MRRGNKMLVDVLRYEQLEDVAQNLFAAVSSIHPVQAIRSLERAAVIVRAIHDREERAYEPVCL